MNLNLQCQDVSKALLSHPGQPEVFACSPLICLNGDKFVLLSVVTPLEMISLKLCAKSLPKNIKSSPQADVRRSKLHIKLSSFNFRNLDWKESKIIIEIRNS